MRYSVLSVLGLLSLPVGAMADLCTTLNHVQRLEAQLFNGTAPTQETLNQIFDLGMRLKDYDFNDASVRETVNEYVIDLALIHISDPIVSTSTRITAHLSTRHRSILRRLRLQTEALCDTASAAEASTAPGAKPGDPGNGLGRLNISFGTVQSIAFAFAITAFSTVIGLWLSARMRLKKRRQKRFACNIEVELATTELTFRARALDISGLGLKIQLPQDVELPPNVKVTIAGRTVDGQVTWKNAHFAGLHLSPHLPRSFVKSVSSGKLARPASKRTEHGRRAHAKEKGAAP